MHLESLILLIQFCYDSSKTTWPLRWILIIFVCGIMVYYTQQNKYIANENWRMVIDKDSNRNQWYSFIHWYELFGGVFVLIFQIQSGILIKYSWHNYICKWCEKTIFGQWKKVSFQFESITSLSNELEQLDKRNKQKLGIASDIKQAILCEYHLKPQFIKSSLNLWMHSLRFIDLRLQCDLMGFQRQKCLIAFAHLVWFRFI